MDGRSHRRRQRTNAINDHGQTAVGYKYGPSFARKASLDYQEAPVGIIARAHKSPETVKSHSSGCCVQVDCTETTVGRVHWPCRAGSGFAEWRHPTRRSLRHGKEQRMPFNLVSNTCVQGPVSTPFETPSLVETDTVVLNTKGHRNRSYLSTNRIKG